MSEMDDQQQARLFDALLNDADRWNTAPHAQARRAAEMDETVAEDLAFVAALRAVAPSRPEAAAARERIAQRLAQLMREEPGHTTAARLRGPRAWLRAVTAPPIRAARNRVTPRIAITAPPARVGRVAAFTGAALVLIVTLLACASVAAGQALPESPLYGLKRAEETLQLDLAMTDGSKGATLQMIASHRLAEATAEADQRRPDEARALLSQFDATLYQLITLTAHAQTSHEEDAASLARAVLVTLTAEQQSAAHATAQGESTFAAAIAASAHAAEARIQQAGVSLPTTPSQSGAGQNTGAGANNGGTGANSGGAGASGGGGKGSNSGGKGNNSGGAHATPTPKPTHTPRAGESEGTTPTTPITPTVAPTATSAP